MNALLLLAACLITAMTAAVFVRLRPSGLMLDHPNDRSLHQVPTPRSGGLAIAAGFLPAAVYVFLGTDTPVRLLLAGWLLVFAVSLIDDLRSLPFWARLLVHVLAALCVVAAPGVSQDPLVAGLGIFWIVWGTNLFNFMDGMDGLAGSMALVGGFAMAVALWFAGNSPLALLSAAAGLAASGFLGFNWPKARIFMGDAGSASLGFLFSAVSVQAVSDGALPAWLPLLVFLPFIGDATLTLLRRLVQRKPVWRAHREHLYQVLVLSGWPVQKVLVFELAVMAGCAVIALLA
ncbi:MAG TPA: glycosyltransferase family 4 protein, partial [Gammaproteobacteria bacterium]